jgi:hypothetical protein
VYSNNRQIAQTSERQLWVVQNMFKNMVLKTISGKAGDVQGPFLVKSDKH